MTDIVEFLTARLDEDEMLAVDAKHDLGGMWSDVERFNGARKVVDELGYSILEGADADSHEVFTGPHIARHDPARVLAEVKAKRALMALHGLETLSHQPAPYELPDGFAGEFVGHCQLCSDLDYPEGLATYYEPWPCPSMRILASVYVEHPDYKQEWSVE